MTGSPLERYTGQLVGRLGDALGDDLVGVWLMGSLALGGYEPERSDIDVLLISRSVVPGPVRRRIADRIGPHALPAPAVGLEFVWYAQADVRPVADPPAFQLNLNGGRGREHKVQLGPGAEAAHWFVIDLAIGRAAARPLIGPPLADVVEPVAPQRLRSALRESLDWHDRHGAVSPDRVLNAARAAVFLRTGSWTSKPAAAARLGELEPSLAPALAAALRARRENTSVDPAAAASVVVTARELCDAAPLEA
jgi:Domain of unknown function (DUF4111)/Nucleotidyltransferase domain